MELKTKSIFSFGEFTLRVSDRALLRAGSEVKLSPKAFALLEYFVTHPEALVTRAQLRNSIWGTVNVADNSVDQRIAELRKIFAEADPSTEYIQNKHGQGWRFAVKVQDPPKERPKGSWKLYAAALAGIAIAAGTAVKIGNLVGGEPRVMVEYRQLTHNGLHKDFRLLTDGRLVYFTEFVSHDAEGDYRTATVPIEGGAITYPPMPTEGATLLDIAAGTGDRLYYKRIRGGTGPPLLWRSKDGSLETTSLDTPNVSISPDGRSLAYYDEPRNFHIRDLGEPPNVRTIPVPGNAARPRWSSDGNRVRFALLEPTSDAGSLWEVRRDGSGLRRLPLPEKRGQQLLPEGWTADGRNFLYTNLEVLGHRSNLWMVGDGEAKAARLTGAPMDFREAVAAPNGSAIFAIGAKTLNELVRFDLKERAFVKMWDGLPAADVSFSKDEAWAALANFPEFTLSVIRADGVGRKQLTWPPLVVHQPHWSPDGKQIAFMGQMPGKPTRIYIVDATGGVPREVKPDDILDQGVPTWSADGRFLVFGELRERKPDAEMTIRILDLQTGAESMLPGSKGKWSPRWSPDGRYIVAQTTDFKEIHLFDCDSRSWRVLVRMRSDDVVWSLDGKYVHFQAHTNRGIALMRVGIEDGKVVELARKPEFEFSWSGVAADGSPMTLQTTMIEDIYALKLKPY